MSRGDRLLIAVLAVLLALAWPLAAAAASRAEPVVLVRSPVGSSRVSLADDATLEIEGRIGTLVVQVTGGRARVTSAECPNLVCVHTGPISAAGSIVACVPNGVTVSVEGRRDGGLDAVSR